VESVRVEFASASYIGSFYDALKSVAQEKIFIEMVEPPPLEKVSSFQLELIKKDGPIFYAITSDRVIGWCDIFPNSNPRQSHRGGLGMGLVEGYRGKGLGSKLLETCLQKAKEFGLEKVELEVYTTNIPAIKMYEKFGFEQEGLIRSYRKLEGVTYDCLRMGKFL
jgi:RimJ/RimL family protein N-acetyltransferase